MTDLSKCAPRPGCKSLPELIIYCDSGLSAARCFRAPRVPSIRVAAARLSGFCRPPRGSSETSTSSRLFEMPREGLFGMLAAEAAAGHVSCQSGASWEKIKRESNQTTSTSVLLLFGPSSVVSTRFFRLCLKIYRLLLSCGRQEITTIHAGLIDWLWVAPAGLQCLKQQLECRRCHYLHQARSHGELAPDCFFILVLT